MSDIFARGIADKLNLHRQAAEPSALSPA